MKEEFNLSKKETCPYGDKEIDYVNLGHRDYIFCYIYQCKYFKEDWIELENELKTLKDFPKEVIGIEDRMISENKLKAEAVKWVNSGEEGMDVKNWIKHFFNLSEEDLK